MNCSVARENGEPRSQVENGSRFRLTLKAPNDGDGGDDEKVEPFEEEAVPESKLRSERNRVRKEGDVPLCSVRRGGNVLLGL